MKEQLKLAGQYRKENKLDKALFIYGEWWNTNFELFNKWDVWSYGYCLLKTNKPDTALAICRKAYPKYNDFSMLRSLYAQSIYHIHFKDKNANYSIETLEKAAKAIKNLTPFYEAYSLAARAYFLLAKAYLNQPKKSWQEVETLIQEMEPDLLDNQAFQMKASGRNISIASDMEQWYAIMIKTKAGLGKYQEVLEILKLTRQQNIVWHYNNDIWFLRLEAFAYHHLGNAEKAEKILRKIIAQRKDWFLLFDLAKIVTDHETKLKLLCDAALARGKRNMKLGLYDYLYIYLEKDFKEVSLKHIALVLAIRKEMQWNISLELEEFSLANLTEYLDKTSKDISNELISFWKEYASETKMNNDRQNGQIINILPNGKSGFIKTNNKSYFTSFYGLKEEVAKGENYSFVLKDSFDKKKNRASLIAVNLRKIKG